MSFFVGRPPSGGASLKAARSTFLASSAQGALVSPLSQPFGPGTTYQTVGAVPGQLALSNGTIVRGAGAAASGTQYALKVRASSADGKREAAETLVFMANGVAPPPTITDIAPGAGWNGSAGSVAGAPTDPTRTTAKPVLRTLVDVGGHVVDPNNRVIGVHAYSFNASGPVAQTVSVWIEGNSYEVPFGSYSYTDANGNARTIWGYFARLKHSLFSQNGSVNVYWTCDPTAGDATMQRRVLGPFKYTRVSFTGYDYDIQVGASLAANGTTIFNTQQAALNYLRSVSAVNPRLTHMENATLVWTGPSSRYAGGDGFLTITTAPGVVVIYRVESTITANPRQIYCDYNGMIFRGAGIKFDYDYFAGFYLTYEFGAATKGVILDGVEIFAGAGAFNKMGGVRTELFIHAGSSGGDKVLILDDTYMHDCLHGFVGGANGIALIRNARLKTIAGDFTQTVTNIYGLTVDDGRNDYYRDYFGTADGGNAAMTLRYDGADATATWEKAYGSTTKITLKSGGVTRLVINVGGAADTDGAIYFDVSDVVTRINAQLGASGWTAVFQSNKLPAACLQSGMASGSPAIAGGTDGSFGGIVNPQSVKSVTRQAYVVADVHGDVVQPTVYGSTMVENIALINVDGSALIAPQQFFLSDVDTISDIVVGNYAVGGSGFPTGIVGQIGVALQNAHFLHCTFADARFALRGNMDARSSIRASMFRSISSDGGKTLSLVFDSNFAETTNFASAVNVTNAKNAGSTITALINDQANGDFSAKAGGNLAVTASMLQFDLTNAPRAATSRIGALA